MKTNNLSFLAVLMLGVTGCDPATDSVRQAQEANKAKVGSTTINTAQADSVKHTEKDDSEFLTKAASGDMLEVQLGQKVAQRTANAEVRQAAEQMISAHTRAGAELNALATKKKLTLPTALGADQQIVYTDVLAKQGTDLDREYVSAMVKDHKEDIKQYQDATTSGADPEVKAFAQKTVPTLQIYLRMFEKLQTSLDAKK